MPTIDASIQEFFSTQDTPNKNINTQPVPITKTVAPEPKPTGKPQPVDPNLLNFFNEEKTNYQKIQPKQSGLVKNPKEDDFGFWRTVGDMTLSIPQGVVNAVEELRQEGLKIKFNFIEKKKNVEVKEIIEGSDIFIEQLIINNYANYRQGF